MPRRRRVYIPGVSSHVFLRGHNRTAIFRDEADCDHFLWIVRLAAAHHGVAVHGYSVMSNHYHLIATPSSATALPQAMQQIDGDYTKYHNRKYERLGTAWCARYSARLLTDERYWLTCLKYVEKNPVAAGIVTAAELYRWSSYRVHAAGAPNAWLVSHPLYDALGSTPAERQAAYRAICVD
jgi:putative transposase